MCCRFRDWYVGAASGPKDLVIVIDVSGSMNQQGRITLARNSALRLIDTLSDVDFVAIVTFSDGAQAADVMGSGGTYLTRATPAAREAFKAWIRANVVAGGTTNFNAALTKAFDLLDASTDFSTGCTTSVLFLSDGAPNPDSWDASIASTIQQRAGTSTHIFTYALGSSAPTDVLMEIACANRGALWAVADGGDLEDAMAAYYTFLAPTLSPCQVRWSYYNDSFSGTPLMAACLPTYKKASPSAASSCNSGTSGCASELLGVVYALARAL